MKALLMHRDRDFDLEAPLPWNEKALVQDLGLDPLLDAMAADDQLVRDVATRALLGGCDDPLYRQAIARDALAHPATLRALYGLTIEAIEKKREHRFGIFGTHPSSILYGAGELMGMYLGVLRRLRDFARAHVEEFASEGMRHLFARLERELGDDYLAEIEAHLAELRFRAGVVVSAELGPGNVGTSYVLHLPRDDDRGWLQRLFARRPAFSFRIAERDEAGAQALSDLRDRGIGVVANALGQAAEHVDGFWHRLRAELAFYVGCLNLHEKLTALGEPTCFPALAGGMRCRGLYDPCLALQTQRAVVGNSFDARGRLVVITGANQGGKTVFLRSIGVAQLMLRSGMFVPAESFDGEIGSGVVTHFKREEDVAMKSGKLDEELVRMSAIADHLVPGAMVLFNESFAATNEREGSEIARQVVSALLERGITVFSVTHLHAFARGVFERAPAGALFLRAERLPDGTRTFRLLEGEPLATSHGRDLYETVFAQEARG